MNLIEEKTITKFHPKNIQNVLFKTNVILVILYFNAANILQFSVYESIDERINQIICR